MAQFLRSRELNHPYTMKLETAKTIGYRTMIMGGCRDPILIVHIGTTGHKYQFGDVPRWQAGDRNGYIMEKKVQVPFWMTTMQLVT
jgi:hypothetical protein